MNRIIATVTAVESVDHITIINLSAHDTPFRMMSLEQNLSFTSGSRVVLGFKASHVSLAKEPLENISISNRIPVTIQALESGVLLCSLSLQFHENVFESIITKNSCIAMKLAVGESILALIKASELSILEVLPS
jgi:molybdopterin-binding protein